MFNLSLNVTSVTRGYLWGSSSQLKMSFYKKKNFNLNGIILFYLHLYPFSEL